LNYKQLPIGKKTTLVSSWQKKVSAPEHC